MGVRVPNPKHQFNVSWMCRIAYSPAKAGEVVQFH